MSTTWKEVLSGKMQTDLAREIDIFETQINLRKEGKMDETMADKVTNDAVAYIQAIAQQRGRNAVWAEEAVRGGASLAAQQAFDENVVDFLARDLDDLLVQLNGHKIAFSGGEVTLHLETATVEMAPMTLP